MNSQKNLSKDFLANLTLLLAILLGAWLRLTPATQAGFPINDGGMFYTMIGDLQKNGYSLPAFTSYNAAENIPFTYPPLGLYIAAVLNGLFHIPLTQLILWLPAFISVLTILGFYLFACELLESSIQAGLATIIFAISPRSFSWFVMGGGLTRGFGILGLLLTLYGARKLFREPSPKNLVITILFGSLTVLSHPEAIVHTVAAAALLWITTARNKMAFLSALQVALGVILLTSPWWGTILSYHGLTPLLNASQTGFPFLFFAVIPFYFTEESMMTLIAVLGIIGLFAEMSRRNYFLPALIFVSFLAEARSAAWVANIALTMMAAIAIDKIILPGLAGIKNLTQPTNNLSIYDSFLGRIFLGYILFYIVGASYLYTLAETSVTLSNEHREAMNWVPKNTTVDSRFILLTPGSDYPMRDPIQEWFPALTERTSLTTLQGREWTLGASFGDSFGTYRNLQSCATQADIQCVFEKGPQSGLVFNYIYINKKSNYQLGSAWPNTPYNPALVESALASGQFSVVYENQVAVILKNLHDHTSSETLGDLTE